MDDKKSSKASVAQSLVAKCHLRGSVPSRRTFSSLCRLMHLKIHFQMHMFTSVTCAIVDVGKIGNQLLSKYSKSKLADVRKLRCSAVSVLPRADEPVKPDQPCLRLVRIYTLIYFYVYIRI